MFEVLVFVYENYWRGDACPEPEQLERKLSAVGFEADEIQEAIDWLSGLSLATHSGNDPQEVASDVNNLAVSPQYWAQSAHSMRVFSVAEQDRLGADCLGFVSFLESSGVLNPSMREIVMDRAMATSGDTVAVDDLKIIILMVYWSLGKEPDALVLDELCDDKMSRIAH